MTHRLVYLIPAAALLVPALLSSAADTQMKKPTSSLEIAPLPSSSLDAESSEDLFMVSYDDGEADIGYTSGASSVYDVAMRFDLGTAPVSVEEVTVCFFRDGSSNDNTVDFDLTFWAADGPGGAPGTLIDAVSRTAQIDSTGTAAFRTYDISAANVNLPNATVYLGVAWSPTSDPGFFYCADQDGGQVQPGYNQFNRNGNWASPPAGDGDYRALILRGIFDDDTTGGGGSDCTPNATTLCLQNDRFEVEVDWTRPDGSSGVGTAVELTADTGYFWFFNSANVEMVVKILNNCSGFSNRYWVFAGGLTNVRVEMRVTDTLTNTTKTYFNPQQTSFQPIQDTNAFATCP